MTTDTDQSAIYRQRIYKSLRRRNLAISVLRFGVPLFGVVVFVALITQIVISNLARDFGISGVRIERDVLVIDAPQYSGITSNGTRYAIAATAASTPVGSTELITLTNAKLQLTRADNYQIEAEASEALYGLVEQKVVVEEDLFVVDSRGMKAKLGNTTIDWTTQRMVARNGVDAVFSDGSVLTADGLVYDAEAQIWDFSSVTLTLSSGTEVQ